MKVSKSIAQLSLLILAVGATKASAQNTNAALDRLPDVVMTGKADSSEAVQGPFLPAMQGTKINAGKPGKADELSNQAMPLIPLPSDTDNLKVELQRSQTLRSVGVHALACSGCHGESRASPNCRKRTASPAYAGISASIPPVWKPGFTAGANARRNYAFSTCARKYTTPRQLEG